MHNLSKAEQDALYAGETLIPYMDENGPVTWRKVPVNPGIGRRRSRVRGRKTLRGRKAAKKPPITKARPTITKHVPINYDPCPPRRGQVSVEPADWCGPYDIDWCWVYRGSLDEWGNYSTPWLKYVDEEPSKEGGFIGQICVRLQFETRYPTVGEWVHGYTNLNLSQVQGARYLGQWQNFQVLGPHEFRMRFDTPGHKITNTNEGMLELHYPDAVVPVGAGMDKISLLEVMPKGSIKMFGMGRRRTLRGKKAGKTLRRRKASTPRTLPKIITKARPTIHGEKIWPLDYNSCPPYYTDGPNKHSSLRSGNGLMIVQPYGGGWTGRQPSGLGPGGSGVPCAKVTFSPWQAKVGEWVTVRTNFNVSGLSGVYIGVNPLQSRNRSANSFEIQFPHPGHWVKSRHGEELTLGFGSARIVLSGHDAEHIVEVRPVYKEGVRSRGGHAPRERIEILRGKAM